MGATVKITAVLTVKNEGAFLLEWLAHHRAVGVTDVLAFSNDCDDGTDRMLDRLAELGWLTHLRNPGPHAEGPQWAALKQADKHPLVREADWLIALDIDEFVNVRVGDRTLTALLAAVPQATAVPLTWRTFGNAGIARFSDQPVTETFTRTAPVPLYWPWRASLFKTLYRNDGTYRKLGVHRPRNPDPERLSGQRWVDGSGHTLPAVFHTKRIFLDPGTETFGLVQLNHYPLGAADSYVLKCDRGRAVHEGERLGMDYWVDRNFCDVEDRSVLALDSRPLRAALHADAVLGALHKAAVAWRRARFAQLMQDEPWRALYGRLLMTPPSRVLPRETFRSLLTMPRADGDQAG